MTVEHYETLLAEVYDWMQGGWEHNVQKDREVLSEFGIAAPTSSAVAYDVGAGTGYQAIPLAELGYHVIAIDPSSSMLDQLRQHVGDHEVTLSAEPLQRHTIGAELICCMGDTLAHFESFAAVDAFFATAAARLQPGGQLIVSYRNSAVPATGNDRFIPVRSDADRIFICFLESVDDKIRVHDILYTRNGGHFEQRISCYDKLRLHPDVVDAALRRHGFVVTRTVQTRGLITTTASVAHNDRMATE